MVFKKPKESKDAHSKEEQSKDLKVSNTLGNEMHKLELLDEEPPDQPVRPSIFRPAYVYTERSLPKGWGVRVSLSNAWTKKFVCNPEGKVFTSKHQAYLFAFSTGSFSELDLNLLKSPFSEAVWKEKDQGKSRDSVSGGQDKFITTASPI